MSAVNQDIGLSLVQAEANDFHRAALACLTEASAIAADLDWKFQAARIDATYAEYLSQSHREIDGQNIQVLRGALDQLRGAAEYLEACARTSNQASDRRDLAQRYGEHANGGAFDLAFRLGEKSILAQMIERRAARISWVSVAED